jgi:hypothetical protein
MNYALETSKMETVVLKKQGIISWRRQIPLPTPLFPSFFTTTYVLCSTYLVAQDG